MAVLRLDEVRKVYGRPGRPTRAALDGVSLAVEAGEVVALLGPSGSGKSTLVGLSSGLDRPTSGTVTVTGQPLGTLNESALARFRRQRIGVVFQAIHLLPSLTVLENVLLPAELARADLEGARPHAHELLERLGIADAADALPEELSGGEQQRAAIARALVNRPSLLLADEPTGALDRAGGAEVLRLLEEVSADERARPAVLLVTHDAELAGTWAQRVVRLLDGRITEDVQLPPVLDRRRPGGNGHGIHRNGENGAVRTSGEVPARTAALRGSTANGAHHADAR